VVEAGIDDLTLYDSSQPLGTSPFGGPVPARLALRAPWPNPATGAVSVVLEMPKAGSARVEVLDLQGRSVATVFEGQVEAGTRVLMWDGRESRGQEAGAGVYFLRVTSGGQTATTRLIQLR